MHSMSSTSTEDLHVLFLAVYRNSNSKLEGARESAYLRQVSF